MIKHIVLTKFTNPTEDAPVAREKLLALKDVIPEILDMRAGLDVLHSARSYDLALEVTFNDLASLNVYAEHPAHMEVRKFIAARRTGSVTVDYEF